MFDFPVAREMPKYATESAPFESVDQGTTGERPRPPPVPSTTHSSGVTVSPATQKSTVVIPKKRKLLSFFSISEKPNLYFIKIELKWSSINLLNMCTSLFRVPCLGYICCLINFLFISG